MKNLLRVPFSNGSIRSSIPGARGTVTKTPSDASTNAIIKDLKLELWNFEGATEIERTYVNEGY